MFNLRFNQVFVALLVLSICSSFLLPTDLADPLRGVGKLFAPIAWPARKVGSAMRQRFAPEQPRDQRNVADVKMENAELRTLVHNLAGQLDEMRRINGEFEELGDVRALCTRFRVLGNDPSPTRESLNIPATSGDGVTVRMPVLYSVGIVGWIDRVNALGAQVQLITDPNFRAAARFAKIVHGRTHVLQTTQPLVVGVGRGVMEITNIPLREVQGDPTPADAPIVGDLVVLDDPDWSMGLRHRPLGQIEQIGKYEKAATFAMIRVRPITNLERLSSVMVMNRTTPDESMKRANVDP